MSLEDKLTVMIHFNTEDQARKFFEIFTGDWGPDTFTLVREILERTGTSCIENSEECDGHFEIEIGG